jgi:hypothetical protein
MKKPPLTRRLLTPRRPNSPRLFDTILCRDGARQWRRRGFYCAADLLPSGDPLMGTPNGNGRAAIV